MRILTFNVNGIRSLHGKCKAGTKECPVETNCLKTLIQEQSPDVLCLQEIRCQNTKELDAYKTTHPFLYTNHSVAKKGYSGTAILSRTQPIKVWKDFEAFPDAVSPENRYRDLFREGRLLTAEFDTYFVICVYTPNSKDELARLSERLLWDCCFQGYIQYLQSMGKATILCGDFNCAQHDIDIYSPNIHRKSAGFSDGERESFTTILRDCKLVDSYRSLHLKDVKYTYWSNFKKARENNRGWRIDYILVSPPLAEKIVHSDCLTDYYGSDHCPVLTEISV
jgi:exodeoxyribonuclease-3